MKVSHLHSAILRGRWLIDKQFADAHMPLVLRLLQGETVDFSNKKAYHGDDEDQEGKTDEEGNRIYNASKVATVAAGNVYNARPSTDLSTLPGGSIVMVTLAGPMLKRGDMCSYGMIDQAALISRLANSPNVSGIILNIDSPGGQADGTAMLSEVIKNTGATKPVIAIIDDGMAASAAMWIASAANEIYVTQETDQVGSIGVYTQIADWAAHYKDYYKLPVTDVYAPQSTDKNKDYKDAINGDTKGVEDDLSVLADQFINTVATNRAGKIKGDKWKTGKMFYAKDAQNIGLIDGQKSLNQVVTRMNKLIKTSTQNPTNNMAFEKTLVTAKAESFAVVDGGFLLEETHLNNIEASILASEAKDVELGAAKTSLASKEAEVATLTAAATTANTTITTQAAKIQELEATIAAHGRQTSGTGSAVIAAGDQQAGGTNKKGNHLDDDHPLNSWADKKLKAAKIKV